MVGDAVGDALGVGDGVCVTKRGGGAVSSNCTSTGVSAPRATASAWYQPRSAHCVVPEHSLSDRRPLQTTSTVSARVRRGTTSSVGMAAGQSWLDQMRSRPEVIFRATDSGETVHVQAGDDRVVRSSAMVTSPPACASSTRGVTTTSASSQGPVGWGSGARVGLAGCEVPEVTSGETTAEGTAGDGENCEGVAELADSSAPTTLADAGSPPSPVVLPSSFAIPTTRSTATPSTRARRSQYTRAGSGPRGLVSDLTGSLRSLTALTLTARGGRMWVPHRAWRGIGSPAMTTRETLHERVLAWFAEHARDLPWRGPGASPWGVLVSEVMLQQTPVARVLPVWRSWMQTWPTPAGLAASSAGDAVRAWGSLGYPRRAVRLHAAASALVERHGGRVPEDYGDLRALPGVGDYTAAAVASFAFGGRHVVLDTNVRRVHARLIGGTAMPAPSLTRAERDRAANLLPDHPATSAAWAVGVMELGALVCTATQPRCADCPVADPCAWRAAGRPPYAGPPRRVQAYAGTDRQCRGRLLAVLRAADGPVQRSRMDAVWTDEVQRERCLAGLARDGLLVRPAENVYALP